MEKIVIHGGRPLVGNIAISGMKNAALPILMGCVLVDDECIIENLPEIHDVTVSLEILEAMGAKVRMLDRNTVAIDATGVRWETGEQAKVLNRIMRDLFDPTQGEHLDKNLKELVGHTPLQVFIGAIIGIIVPFPMMAIPYFGIM